MHQAIFSVKWMKLPSAANDLKQTRTKRNLVSEPLCELGTRHCLIFPSLGDIQIVSQTQQLLNRLKASPFQLLPLPLLSKQKLNQLGISQVHLLHQEYLDASSSKSIFSLLWNLYRPIASHNGWSTSQVTQARYSHW